MERHSSQFKCLWSVILSLRYQREVSRQADVTSTKVQSENENKR